MTHTNTLKIIESNTFKVLFVSVLFLFFNDLIAAPLVPTNNPNYGSIDNTFSSFKAFLGNVNAYLNAIMSSSGNAAKYVEAVFFAFFAYRLAIAIAGFAFSETTLVGVFSVIFLGFIVRILMDFYSPLTSLLLTWSGDASTAIQQPIVGNDDVFFVAAYIGRIIGAISLPSADIWDAISFSLLIVVFQSAIWILSILAFFTVTWGIWGYALAKLIGWFFIPFMLLERTSALFDGWLRFMLGFLFYMLIARANIVFVLVLITTYFGLPIAPSTTSTVQAITVAPGDFGELTGFLTLLIISIIALLSSGKFAASIVGGVGGFGGTIASFANVAARSAGKLLK